MHLFSVVYITGVMIVAMPTRRAFLASAAVAAAEQRKPVRPTVTARSAARVVGAGERIRVGMIGMGGMGTVHLQAFMKQSDEEKDIQVVAVSDIYTRRKNRTGHREADR